MAALLAGTGLAVVGVSMQSILRNPLGSPFTLGISQAGAFGDALSVVVLGAGMITSFIIIAIARIRGATSEIIIIR